MVSGAPTATPLLFCPVVKLKSSKTEAGKLDPLLILVTWVAFVTHISHNPGNSHCPQNKEYVWWEAGAGRM